MAKQDQRARIWPALRTAAAGQRLFSVADVRGHIKGDLVPAETIRHYLTALTTGGILDRQPQTGGATQWRLPADPGPEVPRITDAGAPVRAALRREHLWRTIPILGARLTAADLAVHATTEALHITVRQADAYLRALAKVGIVARTGPQRYAAIASQRRGPQPPIPQPDGSVLDPNTGAILRPLEAV